EDHRARRRRSRQERVHAGPSGPRATARGARGPRPDHPRLREEMTRSIATSLDGQWFVIRSGRQVRLHAAAGGEPVALLLLDSDEAQLAFVGPPATLVLVTREGGALVRPPEPEPVGRGARGARG